MKVEKIRDRIGLAFVALGAALTIGILLWGAMLLRFRSATGTVETYEALESGHLVLRTNISYARFGGLTSGYEPKPGELPNFYKPRDRITILYDTRSKNNLVVTPKLWLTPCLAAVAGVAMAVFGRRLARSGPRPESDRK